MDDDIIDKLPLRKSATTTQLIYLALAMVSLAFSGWMTKGYFDDNKSAIIAAINQVGARAETAIQKSDTNAASINQIRRYYWSNNDQQRWAQQLDRANRTTVPAMIVPIVPEVPPAANTP